MVDLDSGVDKEKICKARSLPQRLQDWVYPVSVDRTYTDGVAGLAATLWQTARAPKPHQPQTSSDVGCAS